MGRAPCCDKSSVKKGPWSPEEDAKLKSYIHQNGTGGNWIALPQKIGLKRCGKSCRLRWLNYLRPNIKHGGFSEEEDNIICSLYISIGSRWSIIAAQLPGRTDNDIKNYWNTRLKKKLLGKHRKEKRGKPRERSSAAAQPPPIPYSSADPPLINDYASIRNLLVRLSAQEDYNIQIEPPPIHPPIYNPIDQLPLLNTTSSAVHYFDMVNVAADHVLPLNLPDFDHSQKLQSLDYFSCDEFINGGTSTSTSTSMEIMNSSIFMNNQGSMMMMMMEEEEEFCADKMRYPGIQ